MRELLGGSVDGDRLGQRRHRWRLPAIRQEVLEAISRRAIDPMKHIGEVRDRVLPEAIA